MSNGTYATGGWVTPNEARALLHPGEFVVSKAALDTMTKATEGHLAATVKSVSDEGPGAFEAIMSMPTLDRDGEVIDAKAFEPLPEHIAIDVDHGMNVEKVVGSGVPFYDGDVLKVSGTFASTPLGQMVRTLVKEGHIRSMSVAYRAAQYADDEEGVPHLRKAELLNAGIVAIPANREAVITAAKSMKADDAQEAHDLAVTLGATCKHAELSTAELFQEVTTTDTDPEDAAATAAAPPADVTVALALAELCLVEASLASLDAP